jgi:hypothetical protein
MHKKQRKGRFFLQPVIRPIWDGPWVKLARSRISGVQALLRHPSSHVYAAFEPRSSPFLAYGLWNSGGDSNHSFQQSLRSNFHE